MGRADEAAAIARFLHGVPTATVGLAIEGEPGIGKTTVWRTAVEAARERGFRVLRASPAEAEADLLQAGQEASCRTGPLGAHLG